MHSTNPLKAKRKVKTNLKTCDMADAPTVKAEEKPVFVKNCMKNLDLTVALASATSKSAKATLKKSEDNKYMLDRWKLYLDSCVTYHSFFAKEFLQNIKEHDTILTGSCNASTTVTYTRGWWGEFEIWLNKQVKANLLSVPILESAGYIMSSHTKKDWVVVTSKGQKIFFKRDTGVCK